MYPLLLFWSGVEFETREPRSEALGVTIEVGPPTVFETVDCAPLETRLVVL
jgi:hypothetical protein